MLVAFHQKAPSMLWKGFQLIAGDGSTVSLPASSQVKKHFGIHSTNDDGINNCLAQLFMLYDIFTGLIIQGCISKMEDSERTLLKKCLGDLPVSKAIFLLDRGFGHFHVFKRFLNDSRDFCVRISCTGSLFGKKIMEAASDDFITYWTPSEKERKTCSKHGLDIKPIRVRVSKVKLKNGEIEILVSSLYDMDTYRLSDLKGLYKLRWNIEEGFKKLKPKMKLEYFGSRKPDGIFQEFEAHIFMINLIAIMGTEAQQEVEQKVKKRKLKYRYNWQNAYRFIRNKLIDILRLQDLDKLIDQLITLLASSIIALKPDRCFPRSPLRKNKTRLHQAYK